MHEVGFAGCGRSRCGGVMAWDGVDSCTVVGGAEVRWRFSKFAGRGRTAAGERDSSGCVDASAV